VGIIDVLTRLIDPFDNVYIVDPISNQTLPYHELDSSCWVIITTNEGSSHRWFDRLIARLQTQGVQQDHIVIRSACLWDPTSPVKHIHTIVDECSDFITFHKNFVPYIVPPSHHYVCLNNGHRWQRYQLIKQLLNRNLDQFGQISYLQSPNTDDARFPMVISKSRILWDEQRDLSLPELTGAMVNLITETAYEPEDLDQKLVYHHRPGMTEKSYKCFALYQIPIWLAPYRAVSCYRSLGFDVFDDIIDHGYDLEIDPKLRISMIVDQIQKICQQPTQNLIELKTKLLPRFEQNWKTLRHYAHNFQTEVPQWAVLFSRNSTS
jgi:hypothetical protein